MTIPNIKIRGIRDPVPPDHVIGRVGSTTGDAQFIPFSDLVDRLTATGALPQPSPTNLTGRPADFTVFFSGKPGISQTLVEFQLTRAITLPAGLPNSQFGSRVLASTSYVVTIKNNGVSIGTITFSGSGAVVSFVSTVNVAIGDTFQLLGQVSADATLQDIWLAFQATFQ
jgi:hypothetical protein